MRYRIRMPPEAKRDVRRLPGYVRQRFYRLVESLADDPWPPEAKGLEGMPGFFRIWVDRFRLAYRVDASDALVVILRAGLKEGSEFCEDLPDV